MFFWCDFQLRIIVDIIGNMKVMFVYGDVFIQGVVIVEVKFVVLLCMNGWVQKILVDFECWCGEIGEKGCGVVVDLQIDWFVVGVIDQGGDGEFCWCCV